jgi:hypothetical protein
MDYLRQWSPKVGRIPGEPSTPQVCDRPREGHLGGKPETTVGLLDVAMADTLPSLGRVRQPDMTEQDPVDDSLVEDGTDHEYQQA